MPLYEYTCRHCGHRFEVLQRVGEGGEQLVCPACGRKGADREFSTFAAAGSASGSSRGFGGGGGCGGGGFT